MYKYMFVMFLVGSFAYSGETMTNKDLKVIAESYDLNKLAASYEKAKKSKDKNKEKSIQKEILEISKKVKDQLKGKKIKVTGLKYSTIVRDLSNRDGARFGYSSNTSSRKKTKSPKFYVRVTKEFNKKPSKSTSTVEGYIDSAGVSCRDNYYCIGVSIVEKAPEVAVAKRKPIEVDSY